MPTTALPLALYKPFRILTSSYSTSPLLSETCTKGCAIYLDPPQIGHLFPQLLLILLCFFFPLKSEPYQISCYLPKAIFFSSAPFPPPSFFPVFSHYFSYSYNSTLILLCLPLNPTSSPLYLNTPFSIIAATTSPIQFIKKG